MIYLHKHNYSILLTWKNPKIPIKTSEKNIWFQESKEIVLMYKNSYKSSFVRLILWEIMAESEKYFLIIFQVFANQKMRGSSKMFLPGQMREVLPERCMWSPRTMGHILSHNNFPSSLFSIIYNGRNSESYIFFVIYIYSNFPSSLFSII